MVHALASVRAVEDALQIEVPENARIVRDLIAGRRWCRITSFTLSPARTRLGGCDRSSKGRSGKNFATRTIHLKLRKIQRGLLQSVQDRVKALVDSGQLSLFTSAIGVIRPIICRRKPTCWPWRITWKR